LARLKGAINLDPGESRDGTAERCDPMRRERRRTALKVVDGKVQRKNRWTLTPNHFGRSTFTIERRRAGYEYRHVLKREDIYRFVELVPDWNDLAKGINKVILDAGSRTLLGWFSPGKVAVCALGVDQEVTFDKKYFYRDIDFFDRLGVSYENATDSEEVEERAGDAREDIGDRVLCHFNPSTAKCFQLMRVLLHELGHHCDYMTNRKASCTRGEDFAENYGRRVEKKLWSDYVRAFGDPVARK
jgi:hypothetical protein